MKEFKFKINGKDYKVAIEESETNIVKVNVNGEDYSVELEKKDETPKPIRKKIQKPKASPPAPAESSSTSVKSVMAPLPGNVLEVKVKVGDKVKSGDVVMVMEAMKMENNVICEHDGEVTSIPVNLGQAVMQNDVLIEIK